MGWDVSRSQIPGVCERYRPQDLLEGRIGGIREGRLQGDSRTFCLRNQKERDALSWDQGKEGSLLGRKIKLVTFEYLLGIQGERSLLGRWICERSMMVPSWVPVPGLLTGSSLHQQVTSARQTQS